MGLGDQSHLNESWNDYINPQKTAPRRVAIPEKHLWTYTYDKENQKLIKLLRPFNMVHGKKQDDDADYDDDYDEFSGGAVGENISSTAESVSDIVGNVTGNSIMEGLEKAGIFQGTKDALGSVTRKLDWTLRNPAAAKKFRITSNLIPNLQFQYEKNANFLAVKGNRLKDFRKDNIKLRMMNIESKIKRELAKVQALDESKIDLDYSGGGTCTKKKPTGKPYECFKKGVRVGEEIQHNKQIKEELTNMVPLSKSSKYVLTELAKLYGISEGKKPDMLKELRAKGVKGWTMNIHEGSKIEKMPKRELIFSAKEKRIKVPKGIKKDELVKLMKEQGIHYVGAYRAVLKK
jgi:hypothetical protein